MNEAQSIMTKLTTRVINTTKLFRVYWLNGNTEEIEGTDIIDAFKKIDYPIENMSNMSHWEFVNESTKTKVQNHFENLAHIKEEEVFEIDIGTMKEVDFALFNGKLPKHIADGIENGSIKNVKDHYNPPTLDELLSSWGWNDSLKAISIKSEHIENYHHKFLLAVLHLTVPVLFEINDMSNLPTPVKKRQFVIDHNEKED